MKFIDDNNKAEEINPRDLEDSLEYGEQRYNRDFELYDDGNKI